MLFMEFIIARHPKGSLLDKITQAVLTCSFRSDFDHGVRLISEAGQEVYLKDFVGACRRSKAGPPALPAKPPSFSVAC
jgi:hypothetical protein